MVLTLALHGEWPWQPNQIAAHLQSRSAVGKAPVPGISAVPANLLSISAAR